jgi:two-component system response regulator PilR (NtrC family)
MTKKELQSPTAHILVVDDEPGMCEFLEIMLRKHNYQVTACLSAHQALKYLEAEAFDLVISDISMPEMSGIELLGLIRERSPGTEVIMITAFASPETAIRAMKLGAYDYITKPFNLDAILLTIDKALKNSRLQRENRQLRRELEQRYGFGNLIGKSPAMTRVFELIERVAPSKANILVTGKSGTGKELVARAIHFSGPRKDRPFITVNCGAIPAQLMESELFGHEQGAFTGALKARDGYFAAADGGTIFLDEVGEIPLPLQVKLLRVIQERRFSRVGSTTEREVDVRIIAATNRDLEAAVTENGFREDLFYRLNVIRIDLPELRQRSDDILLLARHFLQKYNREYGRNLTGFTPEAMKILLSYNFPGNVRELENIVERGVIMASGENITPDSLPPGLDRPTPASGAGITLPAAGIELDHLVAELECSLIRQALERSGGTITEAAKLLGLSFRSLRYRLEKYQLN